jgi:hypothetical protein
MPPVKLPQREILRRLLDSGKLTPGDTVTVRKLYDDLLAGRMGGLNHPQSVLVQALCEKCGVVVSRARPNDKKKTKDDKERILADFDAMPRPKKPPGRG